MPVRFSDQEEAVLRDRLIASGRELFGKYGLKKTSVGELAKMAGIATGSFYRFFPSKEELLMLILEEEERNTRAVFSERLLAGLSPARKNRKALHAEGIRDLLLGMFRVIEEKPIARLLFDSSEIDLLVRKLSPERIRQHIKADTEFSIDLIERLQAAGVIIQVKSEVVAALFRSLFFLMLYKKEIGEGVFPEVMELLSLFVAEGLTGTHIPAGTKPSGGDA